MKQTKRIRLLCGQLAACETFADVGCDHGYCTQYMLEENLCRRAVVSDISAGSLSKAEKLLSAYIAAGRVAPVCCPGLEKIPKCTEQVLIAGMGGEEILNILREGFLPPALVLQPMRHAPKVRAYLLEQGYSIVRDFTFFDGKFYDVLRAEFPAYRGAAARSYGERELTFGYDNIHSPSPDFLQMLEEEMRKCRARLAAAQKPVPAVEEKLRRITEVYHDLARSI